MKGASKDISDAWDKGQKEGHESFVASQAKKGLVPDKTDPNKTPQNAVVKSDAEKTKAAGQKTVNIHITIGNLVKELSVVTNNMKEGTSKIHDMIAATLVSAVNDSQIIGEH